MFAKNSVIRFCTQKSERYFYRVDASFFFLKTDKDKNPIGREKKRENEVKPKDNSIIAFLQESQDFQRIPFKYSVLQACL